ncbi:hypothetical protein C9374_010726 [Naegleria lovaniensis]|uniref:Uncharacterized protein n=1 Tax=Naegleria lovaniensis TaxID=51637 RepID=A0AA88GF39_NAELO|nr:uncharacterized protein C9374_010726 [Naegleria lovaniensis]KAG2374442.1 hypothetical protein C9374_010726 [Naegleria lovaniensis]
MSETASATVENVQKNIKQNLDRIKEDAQKLVRNLKEKKTNLTSDDLRVLSLGLLAFWTLLALLVPGILRFLFASSLSITASNSYDAVRVVDEFVRLSGAFSLALLVLNYMSVSWPTDAQNDVLRVMTLFNALVFGVSLIGLMSGGTFLYVLVAGVSGALTFFYAKAAKLF